MLALQAHTLVNATPIYRLILLDSMLVVHGMFQKCMASRL